MPRRHGSSSSVLAVFIVGCALFFALVNRAAAQTATVSAGASASAGSSGASASAGASVEVSGGGGGGGSSFFKADGQKAGRFMFDLKIGPALCLVSVSSGRGSSSCPLHMGTLVFDLGWSVIPNLYLVFPFQLQFRDSLAVVMLPVGFQYDIALPVKNLYIYPRAAIGYAAYVLSASTPGGTINFTSNLGVFMPEFGIKYIIKGRINVGAEPFSLPIFFSETGMFMSYRILVYGGVNF